MTDILVDWGNQEETFLVVTIEGKWTIRDMADFMQEVIRLINSKSHDVAVIIDLRRSGRVPQGIMTAAENILREIPPNLNKMILLSQSSLWRSIWYAISSMYRHEKRACHFVKTVDDAYALIPDTI